MEATLTPEERLGRADQELQDLKNSFVEAINHLQQSPVIDGSFEDRLEAIQERLRRLRQGIRIGDLDKVQVNEFHSALWEIKDLIDEHGPSYNLDIAERLLVCIERVRHVIRDALDEHVGGVSDDAGLVVSELRSRLPNTSMEAIGRLIGVDRRTLYRWEREHRTPTRRLRLVARLVAVLRHSWTEEGIMAWFDRPRRGLGDRKPLAFLDNPNEDELLLMEARSGRSQYAS